MARNSLRKGTLSSVKPSLEDLNDTSEEDYEVEDVMSEVESTDEANDESEEKTDLESTQRQLKSIPFSELLEAQRALKSEKVKFTQKNGAKLSKNRRRHESPSDSEDDDDDRNDRSKHAPVEMSSKRAVPRFREVVHVPKPLRRDPRFDTLSGNLNVDKVKNNYGFVMEYRLSEIKQLEQELKSCREQERRERIKEALKSLRSKLERRKEDERTARVLKEHRQSEKEKIRQGKKPFYLKKSEQKKLLQLDKYKSMEGTKALDRYMEKKQKRRAQKEKKRLPRARPDRA
ncbi:DUF947 family rRNA processing protein [Schizosaccharomyces japonicus yFS275]|uniref:rRNA biogenesis protein rrp36 n=1 Tax=Schizosaccharomyces japonicus (strain yFS275 / FY16936) TaxID=402676 RepID=RRP36_SCHJY|nr:DUF947 family rRNA processing protein [Schizosaccharomyces japonicus yFS275]B6K8A0.2 RecName: Full=rRNA biogenesis protein rrp36; AltName: Full=Ribosomal RNA-processing protein 36 [Schizosaccharomyces japonicus yFS275]EEB09754.2 DUF947 family rRNA processing protein [Schizosaccharomyces japonicus yFS275]